LAKIVIEILSTGQEWTLILMLVSHQLLGFIAFIGYTTTKVPPAPHQNGNIKGL
jgi:hypothetical protein